MARDGRAGKMKVGPAGVPFYTYTSANWRDEDARFRRAGATWLPAADIAQAEQESPSKVRTDHAREWVQYERHMTPARAAALAVHELKLPRCAASLVPAFRVGWRGATCGYMIDWPAGWVVPEWNGEGAALVGGAIRAAHPEREQPKHSFVAGWGRGLTLPPHLGEKTGPLLVGEGFSDCLAGAVMGLAVVGRPSNRQGAEDIAALARRFPDHDVTLIAENDLKPSREWPGYDGTLHVAQRVAELLGRPVRVAVMPDGAKDVRAWLTGRCDADTTAADCLALGRELLQKLEANSFPVGEPIPAEDEPHFDTDRHCPNAFAAQLEGRAGTSNEGRRAVAHFRCKRWSCTACNPRKAATLYRHVRGCILTAAHPLCETGAAQPSRPARLYATLVADEDEDKTCRGLRNRRASYIRILCLIDHNRHEAFRRLKPIEDKVCLKSPSLPPILAGLTSRRINTAVLIVAAIAPEHAAPGDFIPLGTGEAVQLLGSALSSVPTWHTVTGERSRPVRLSSRWSLPEQEPGSWSRTGSCAFDAPTVAQIAADCADVGVSVGGRVASPDVQGEPTCWTAPPVASWVFSRLLAPTEDKLPRTPWEVRRVFRRWAGVISPGQPLGPAVREIVNATLWDGPEPCVAQQLADADAADRAHAEQLRIDQADARREDIERTNATLAEAGVDAEVGPSRATLQYRQAMSSIAL